MVPVVEYRSGTWFDPRLVPDDSAVHGRGLFVSAPVATGLSVVARRDIAAGGQIVGDYAIWESEPRYRLDGCRCGSTGCRGTVTGDDWRRPELRERYRGHFLPLLERWIATRTADGR